jgi:23S rRNA pseudouridine955/2504/2580 synthase
MKKTRFEDLILFENEDYIIINKPPYFSTLEDRHEAQNILDLAKSYSDDAQVCHRLDKETSGCLAISKHAEAYRNLAIQFENREVIKVYHAVVEGLQDFQDTAVDRNLQSSAKGKAKVHPGGKPALTYFSTVKKYQAHTLVACRPVTGRLHQIRVHLSYLNAPIVGDELYGGKPLYLSQLKRKFNLKKGSEELPIMQRVALHAQFLGFIGLSDEEVAVEAPYPKDFAVLIKQLDKTE